MKYTSIEDWNNLERWVGYTRYLAGVWDRLPEDLQRLTGACLDRSPERIYLHDSRVGTIRVEMDERTAESVLDGETLDASGVRVSPRRYVLRYGGVVSFRSACDPDGVLPGPAGYGDLGADELEEMGGGLFEHRLLFSSGIELAVGFREFSLSYEDDPA